MNPKLQAKLFKKYPKIFKQRKLPMTQTAMCWGIDTGDGWYWLIDKLCEQLTFDTKCQKFPQVEATQVKEKFGGLRFYTNGTNTYQDTIIYFACNLSYGICEHCGSTNDVKQTKGWVKTLCKECMKQHGK